MRGQLRKLVLDHGGAHMSDRAAHSAEVVGLAGRIEGDGPLLQLLRQRSERDVRPVHQRQVGVDFVGDHQQVVVLSQLPQASQLLKGKHAAGGVVRVHEEEHLRLAGHGFRLAQVELPPCSSCNGWHREETTARPLDRFDERWVRRCEQEYPVAGSGREVQDEFSCLDQVCENPYPPCRRGPAVPGRHASGPCFLEEGGIVARRVPEVTAGS